MKNTWSKIIIRIFIVTGFILLVPLVAMQFTHEVNWSLADFVVMGALLFGTGLTIEFVTEKLANPTGRMMAIMIILALFFLIWAELAVGIFGTPFAGS
ncbi:MAG: hypothetical protein U1C56_00320 [Candidatus Curtissbacteria bacterium]|nr:hypothetical protein [Candidatus Curtissbacteria bacterium]